MGSLGRRAVFAHSLPCFGLSAAHQLGPVILFLLFSLNVFFHSELIQRTLKAVLLFKSTTRSFLSALIGVLCRVILFLFDTMWIALVPFLPKSSQEGALIYDRLGSVVKLNAFKSHVLRIYLRKNVQIL